MKASKHGLIATFRNGTQAGWKKRLSGEQKWVCSVKIAPTVDEADSYYEEHFAEFWKPPVAEESEVVCLKHACHLFFVSKTNKVKTGALEKRSLDEYALVIRDLLECIDGDKPFEQLTPADFDKFNEAITKRFGVARKSKWIIMTRSIFKWANGRPLLLPFPDYGESFVVPSRRVARAEERHRVAEDGELLFTPSEVLDQIAEARYPLKAMIALAVFNGLGNRDIAQLRITDIDFNAPFFRVPRGKTGGDRRSYLLPITLSAIRHHLAKRMKKQRVPQEVANLMFLTQDNRVFVDYDEKGNKDVIAQAYTRLLARLDQTQRGRGFYTLRRTYRTLAAEIGEELAVSAVLKVH